MSFISDEEYEALIDRIKEMEAVIRHHEVVQQQLRAELAKRDARIALLEEALGDILENQYGIVTTHQICVRALTNRA